MRLDLEAENRRLTIRVRELEEELAEWQRRKPPGTVEPVSDERVWKVERAVGCRTPEARLLLALMDANGKILGFDWLDDLVRYDRTVEGGGKLASVYVCRLRKRLIACGVGDVIETVPARGYRMAPASAASLAARWPA